MSLLAQLLRHYRYAWTMPQVHCPSRALRANLFAAAAGCQSPPPPPTPLPLPVRQTGRNSRAPFLQQQQRRCVAAAAGQRGNVFLDDSAAERRKPLGGDDGEPTSLAPLFDSSRFNYDSDEDEEQGEGGSWEDQPDQQHGSAPASAAALQQQQRRRGGATAGAVAGEGAAAQGQVVPEQQQQEEAVEVVLPPPRGVKVKSAEFVKSSVNVSQCPPARFPEFAVIGRSNVGKSSLINMLTGRNALALVSKTPGKTRCINHFIINGAWYLVDLPGYGYAKASKTNVVEWNKFTREYFLERETLVTVLLLVDASIPPTALDVACAAWFADAEIPFTVVFTKLDKRKKGGPPAEENIAAFEQKVEEACGYVPPTILTSSKSGKGRNELLSHVAQLREFFNKTHHGM